MVMAGIPEQLLRSERKFTCVSDAKPPPWVPERSGSGLLKEFGLAGQWLSCLGKARLAVIPLGLRSASFLNLMAGA